MPPKPFRYNELSDKVCITCGKRLKKNVMARKPEAETCYKCDRTAKNNQNGILKVQQ